MNFFLSHSRVPYGGGDIALNLLLMSLVLNYNELLKLNYTASKISGEMESSLGFFERWKGEIQKHLNEFASMKKIAKLQKGNLKIVHFEVSAMSETSAM